MRQQTRRPSPFRCLTRKLRAQPSTRNIKQAALCHRTRGWGEGSLQSNPELTPQAALSQGERGWGEVSRQCWTWACIRARLTLSFSRRLGETAALWCYSLSTFGGAAPCRMTGRDCVKSLRSSYTVMCSQSTPSSLSRCLSIALSLYPSPPSPSLVTCPLCPRHQPSVWSRSGKIWNTTRQSGPDSGIGFQTVFVYLYTW
jgi:hypothetical protein